MIHACWDVLPEDVHVLTSLENISVLLSPCQLVFLSNFHGRAQLQEQYYHKVQPTFRNVTFRRSLDKINTDIRQMIA